MKRDLIIYHGSQQIVEVPKYGIGKKYNDYGTGFYCTENKELAKEWACPVKNDGYSNRYLLHLEGLNMIHLTEGEYNILSWLAILLNNRMFDITSAIGKNAREFILERFLPDTKEADIMIGYRADDSYFSYAEDFVNNTLSLRDLNYAMQLGKLGEQIVLLSKRAFSRIEFIDYEIADYHEYYFKRLRRDREARISYTNHKDSAEFALEDMFILDIMREDMFRDDPRLQSIILG